MIGNMAAFAASHAATDAHRAAVLAISAGSRPMMIATPTAARAGPRAIMIGIQLAAMKLITGSAAVMIPEIAPTSSVITGMRNDPMVSCSSPICWVSFSHLAESDSGELGSLPAVLGVDLVHHRLCVSTLGDVDAVPLQNLCVLVGHLADELGCCLEVHAGTACQILRRRQTPHRLIGITGHRHQGGQRVGRLAVGEGQILTA